MRASIILQRGRKPRLEQGQPWIYANEVDRMEGAAEPGALVDIVDHKGKYLATGYWNPQSRIVVRIVAYEPVEMDLAFFTDRLRQALAHRERFLAASQDCRLVYGEADYLPGLTVDRFGSTLVVQILSLGMEVRREILLAALLDVFKPACIYERSDVGVRTLEGLEPRVGVLYGEAPGLIEIEENGLLLEVDIEKGQKTGYFYDQRENRASIAPLMRGWGARSGIRTQSRPVDQLPDDYWIQPEAGSHEAVVPVNKAGKLVTYPYWDGATVLECFAHTGSFTLHACKYGAKKVTCLDVSEHAIETAKRNVARNGFEDRVEFEVADAFAYLREQAKGIEERRKRAGGGADTSVPLGSGGRTWDVVILDPPAFAKTKQAAAGAMRGYKDINLHGMKLVNEGGYLVTASCSYHMRPEMFLQAIQEAASDAGKLLRLIEWRTAGKDHPQLLGVSEGHYLKFGIFEVRSR
ncbi:class I SAM-dependent rRNA methyltransferase [Paenibacillus daejeonensis]|uniref:class I SAM-dependent rRNA methyltransferase n=1 Tax=Paenibacillus daejeonensis TaxID=135193 RepID=UPI00037A54B8|nr:class I SAM-dependent rRNA methyltransferase [Paenibacillus daejeonensis]